MSIRVRNYAENKLFSSTVRMNGDYIKKENGYSPFTLRLSFIEMGLYGVMNNYDRISGQIKASKLVRDAIKQGKYQQLRDVLHVNYARFLIKHKIYEK